MFALTTLSLALAFSIKRAISRLAGLRDITQISLCQASFPVLSDYGKSKVSFPALSEDGMSKTSFPALSDYGITTKNAHGLRRLLHYFAAVFKTPVYSNPTNYLRVFWPTAGIASKKPPQYVNHFVGVVNLLKYNIIIILI